MQAAVVALAKLAIQMERLKAEMVLLRILLGVLSLLQVKMYLGLSFTQVAVADRVRLLHHRQQAVTAVVAEAQDQVARLPLVQLIQVVAVEDQETQQVTLVQQVDLAL
jgi:hypothetical protein